MKICLCIDKLGNGGAERVLSILANQFSALSHEVYLVETSTKNWTSFYDIDNNIKRVCLLDYTKKSTNFAKLKALRLFLKKVKPNVIISFKYQTNINVFLANLFLRIPHIVSERNNPYIYDIGLSSKLFKKVIFRKANGCVFQTEDAMKFYFNREKKTNIIIPNPVHLSFVPDNKALRRNNVILYVGRLDAQKNVKLLLDSFEKLFKLKPDYKLKIYGCGVLEHDLKEYAKKLDSSKNIFFVGTSRTWHKDELNSLMFVLPSDYEGMPNSLMEAMALQIPCISTDCPIGGPKSLITNGVNGLLIPTKDINALAEAMLFVANHEEERELMAISNKNMAADYSEESIAKQWIGFINQILGK